MAHMPQIETLLEEVIWDMRTQFYFCFNIWLLWFADNEPWKANILIIETLFHKKVHTYARFMF